MPDEMKLDFLYKALENNEFLRHQFILIFNESDDKSSDIITADPGKVIAETAIYLKNRLESLDFNKMDWREYIPPHSGYIEDYEAWEYFAQEHLDDIFNGWGSEILTKISHAQLVNAVCFSLGMYDACLNAAIPGSDQIFEDLTGTLLQEHKEIMTEATDKIMHTVKSENQAMKAIEIVLDHYLACYRGMKDYLKYFESLLISLTETEKIAGMILSYFENSAIDDSWVPKLAVKIASFDEDPLIWIEKAEELMESDLDVAKQLLDHYWTNDSTSFRLVGLKLFREHPVELCDYFSELLFPMFDEEFYKQVLYHKTLRDRDIDSYNLLRNYLDEEERARFADKINFDELFKVNVLAVEEKYSEILKFAQKKVLHTYNFTEMILPVLNIYPHEVLELIRIKCDHMLQNHKKRSGYRHVAEWLKLSLQIASKEDDARHLIHELYNRKPVLPALREEMRRAGVI